MLIFAQSFQDRLEQSGRKFVFRLSVAFPGYDTIVINDGAAATGTTLTVNTAAVGNYVLTEGVDYNATADNYTLAVEIADWINANIREARATAEKLVTLGSGSSSNHARLVVYGTRASTTVTLNATGSWSTAVASPTTGWNYEAVTGDEPISGYMPIITGINGLGRKMNPVDRSSSFPEVEVTLSSDPRWKWAISVYGIRNSSCTLYLGVWGGGNANPPWNAVVWNAVLPLWARDTRLTSDATGMVLDLVGIDGYMAEKRIRIPTFLGRHPLQVMQECLDAGGFTKSVDSRIDWASFAPTTDPDRGHFNMSFFRDTSNAINVASDDEGEYVITLWDALQELVALTGGTLRLNASGQLEHVPYDEDAAALAVWDVNPGTSYEAMTPEVLETEAFLTNRVEWDFAQAQGGEPGVAEDNRSATFVLEDENSKTIYNDTFSSSFESRWLNAVSYADYPYGARGNYEVLDINNNRLGFDYTTGYRTGYNGDPGSRGKDIVGAFWHNKAGNAAGGYYGYYLLSSSSINYGTAFDPAGETDVTLMAWVHTDGSGDARYVGRWNGSNAGWYLGQTGRKVVLYFHNGTLPSHEESIDILYETNALGVTKHGWFLVVATYSAGTVRFYVNGSLVSSSTSGTIPATWPTATIPGFKIGPGYGGASEFVLNNITYWDSVLNTIQRDSLYRGLGYPLITYSGLTSVPEPSWWLKGWGRSDFTPEVGSSASITLTGAVGSLGETFGVDDSMCLRTAAMTGFCGTRTSMGIPGTGVTTTPTAITGEDAVATLGSGRVAYLMIQPHDAVLPERLAQPFNQQSIRNLDFHFVTTSSALEDSDYSDFKAAPEIVKVGSHFLAEGYPVGDRASGVTYVANGSATSKPGARNAQDPVRGYRLPINTWMTVDTSYNSEGFTAGRGGFGTYPPRLNASTDINEDINLGCGGWHLNGVRDWERARIVDVTIPAYRSKEILSRFKFGAWRLSVRTPLSKMAFQVGDVISLDWDAFFAQGRVGLDSTATFEIVSKTVFATESEVGIQWELVRLKDTGVWTFPTTNPTFPTLPTTPGGSVPLDVVTNNALVDVGVDYDLDTIEDEVVTI